MGGSWILSTTIVILFLVATILIRSSLSGWCNALSLGSNALLLLLITGQHKHGWWVADNSELSLWVSHYKYTSLPLITSQLYTTCQVPRLRRSRGYVFSLWHFKQSPTMYYFRIPRDTQSMIAYKILTPFGISAAVHEVVKQGHHIMKKIHRYIVTISD